MILELQDEMIQVLWETSESLELHLMLVDLSLIETFVAPELQNPEHNKEVDIFSYGIMLFEIEAQERCWSSVKSVFEITKLIDEGKPPGDLSKCPNFQNIIIQCIKVEATLRPNFDDITKYLNANIRSYAAQMSQPQVSSDLGVNKLLSGLMFDNEDVRAP